MTRRPPKPKTTRRVRFIGWMEEHWTMFDLADRRWSPPAQVRVVWGLRSSTWTAVFTRADGAQAEAKARLSHNRDGSYSLVESGMSFRFRTYGRAS